MPKPRFPATRDSALRRLDEFVPRAGPAYAAGRNTDEGPDRPGAVSRLSPYVRHRLVTEREIVERVLATHGHAAAGKFVQEVLWRSYWKGWLEMRPAVWSRFLAERDRQREALADVRGVVDAERGATGTEGFDDWARELVATGYLHNHARMWFASIWIFTLRLPWALGADFFLRHLLDADAASNTLSWRWVAGLQTAGKTYLATAENIARHTHGRFAPAGLAREAIALAEAPLGAPAALPEPPPHDPREPAVLLVTTEDLHPESLFPRESAFPAALVAADGALLWGDAARRFAAAAATDTVARSAAHFGRLVGFADRLDLAALVGAARAAGVRRIVAPYAPVGPVADALTRLAPGLADEGITLRQVRREWDSRCWPHAQKGFFAFRERMPAVLGGLGLA
jgi:deoxyribodipyrimidine photo-lyase